MIKNRRRREDHITDEAEATWRAGFCVATGNREAPMLPNVVEGLVRSFAGIDYGAPPAGLEPAKPAD